MLITHDLSSQDAFDLLFSVSRPSCACGCGTQTSWNGWRYGYATYIHSHNPVPQGDAHWTRQTKNAVIVQDATIAQTSKNNPHVSTRLRRAESFVERSRNRFGVERFALDDVIITYESSHRPVMLTCRVCVLSFRTTPYVHLHTTSGGCRTCFLNNVSVDAFEYLKRIKEIHGDEITWLNPRKIRNVHQHEEFKCTSCERVFSKTFNNLIVKRYGCPYHNGPSKGQLELHEAMSKFGYTLLPPEQTINLGHRKCRVDCLFPEQKLVVEYYGDWWHGNPEIYDFNDLIGSDYSTVVEDKWRSDAKRQSELEAAGYRVHIVWERDWKQNPVEQLESIKMELERLE